MNATIAPMTVDDISGVTRLAAQLGYPTTNGEVAENFSLIRQDPFQEVFVAKSQIDGAVVGWLHIYRHLSIPTGPRAEIGGLVVEDQLRGRGIGTSLMAKAEHWAEERRLKFIRFTSRVSRTEAHRLYARLGYQIQKTSHVFNKAISVQLE